MTKILVIDDDVKIVAISGDGRTKPKAYLGSAENLGAQYTFSKPVERKALIKAVQDLLP